MCYRCGICDKVVPAGQIQLKKVIATRTVVYYKDCDDPEVIAEGSENVAEVTVCPKCYAEE